jgi:hypothetical protein
MLCPSAGGELTPCTSISVTRWSSQRLPRCLSDLTFSIKIAEPWPARILEASSDQGCGLTKQQDAAPPSCLSGRTLEADGAACLSRYRAEDCRSKEQEGQAGGALPN